jgi:leucyl aminopeptidase
MGSHDQINVFLLVDCLTLLLAEHLPDLCSSLQVDRALGEEAVVLQVPGCPGNRLLFASTGPVNRDYDDVRRYSDAAICGIKRWVL